MKKEYVAPVLDLIEFDMTDIISHSNAVSNGETVVDPWAIFDTEGDITVN